MGNSLLSPKDSVISVLDELPADRVLEVLDFALFLQQRSQGEQRRVKQLFDAAGLLSALDAPPLTEAEIEAEIQAARAERRAFYA